MADTEDSRDKRRIAKREWMRAWRAANPDEARDRNRAWRAANPEKVRKTAAKSASKWAKAHPEKARARTRAWLAANPEKAQARNRARYAANPEKAREHTQIWRAANPKAVAYMAHKAGAKKRRVPFLLTFDEWLAIWTESGKWEQRGPRTGQYVMARYRDLGPYAVGNVRICPTEENLTEKAKYMSTETHKRLSEAVKSSWSRLRRHDTSGL